MYLNYFILMEIRHYFVPLLDVSEKIPFAISLCSNTNKNISCQESAKKELNKFINSLSKNLKEKVVYIGMDVIGEKYYERYLFEKGGFLEIMMEAPLAINAHFSNKVQAKKFEKSLKVVLGSILKKDAVSKMFLDSIGIGTDETNLKVSTWDKLKNIRK